MKILSFVIPATMLVIAVWLFSDAMLMALRPMDPVTGRISACFTDVELWLGFKKPSTWVREAEFILSIILVPLSIFVFQRLRRATGGVRVNR